MKVLIILGISVLVGIPLAFWEHRQRAKAIEKAFAGRKSRSDQEFYEEYFKSQGIPEHVVYDIKAILENILDADLSRLTDEDDFSKNLSFFWRFDSMADVELLMALEERFKIEMKDTEVEQTLTVGDIVNLVWRKLQEQNAKA